MQQSDRRSAHRKLLSMTSNAWKFLKRGKFYASVDKWLADNRKSIYIQYGRRNRKLEMDYDQYDGFSLRSAQRRCLQAIQLRQGSTTWNGNRSPKPEIPESQEIWQIASQFQWLARRRCTAYAGDWYCDRYRKWYCDGQNRKWFPKNYDSRDRNSNGKFRVSSVSMWSKTQACRWNFDDVYRLENFRLVTSGLLAILLFPVVVRNSKHKTESEVTLRCFIHRWSAPVHQNVLMHRCTSPMNKTTQG